MNNIVLKLLSKFKPNKIGSLLLYLFSFETLYLFIVNLIHSKPTITEKEFALVENIIPVLVKKEQVHYIDYVAHQVIHEIDLKSLVGDTLDGHKELMGFLACYLEQKHYPNFTHKILDLYPQCAHYEVKNVYFLDLKTGKDRFNLLFLSMFSHDKNLFLKVLDKIEPDLQNLFLEFIDFINNHERRLDLIRKSTMDEVKKAQREDKLTPFVNSCYLGLEWIIELNKLNFLGHYDEQFYLYESLFKTQYFWEMFEKLPKEEVAKIEHFSALYNFVLIRMQYTHWIKEKELFQTRSYIDFLEKKGYDFNQRFLYKFEQQNIVTIILLIKTFPNYFLVGLLLEEILSKPKSIIEKDIILDGQKRSIFQILKLNRYDEFISLIEQKVLLLSFDNQENNNQSYLPIRKKVNKI